MKYNFEQLKKENTDKLEEVATIAGLDEPIDYDCTFIVAKNGTSKILGFAGVNLNKDKYPQFEHIIVRPGFQKTKLGFLLMLKMEKFLRHKGYTEYVSFIRNEKNNMMVYAQKWGMQNYAHNNRGVWFYKSLIGGKR